jgi:hypothetical protein
MEFVLIKRDSPEWHYIWTWLEKHPINEGINDPSVAINNQECWQYTGTFKNGKDAVHSFRHKNHPKTNYIINLSLNASDSFSDDQIEINKKM